MWGDRMRVDTLQQEAGNSALLRLLKATPQAEPYLRAEEPLERYLYEQYAQDRGAWRRRAYYRVKPLVPRPIQIALRRCYAASRRSGEFPRWPIETRLIDLVADAIARAVRAKTGSAAMSALAPWPCGARFAFCITHDVEWAEGLRRAPDLMEVERRAGMVSSWNLVPERYAIDWRIVEALRSSGSEIGVHGLKHDGRLFESMQTFLSRLERIEAYAQAWGAEGFRSPSCLRQPEWMQAMHFLYDSSFPDTDPYEPQPGGCCSVWPYFLGNMVELPLTVPQDHTVYEILQQPDLSIWERKADWLEQVGGLVMINAHPDYLTSAARLRDYEQFLGRMKQRAGMWHALPRQIAAWWRERDESCIRLENGRPVAWGPAARRATVISLADHPACTARGSRQPGPQCEAGVMNDRGSLDAIGERL